MIAVVAMHSKLLPFGWAGVWLFLVISGYVVTRSIVSQYDAKSARSLIKAIYLHRIARVVYYVYVIALATLASPITAYAITRFAETVSRQV